MAVKLKTFTCPFCSAPVQVPPEVHHVQCMYCRNTINVERNKPPPPPSPVVHGFPAPPSNTIYVDPRTSSRIGTIILFATLVPILLGVIGTVVALIGTHNAVSGVSGGSGGAGGRSLTAFPASCGMNESVVVKGQTFSGKGTLIEMAVNCKLTIQDSTLKADAIVEAGVNGTITIVNSKLEAQDTAIKVGSNGKIKLTGASEVASVNGVAIEGEANTEVTLEQSKLRGVDSAVHTNVNTKVKATGSEITGKDRALDFGINGNVDLDKSTVRAEGEVIFCRSNLAVETDGSVIEGGEVGISASSGTKVRLTKKSRVTGKDAGIRSESNLELSVEDSVVESNDVAVRTGSNPRVKIAKQGRVRGTRTGLLCDSNLDLSMNEGTLEAGGNAVQGQYNASITAKNSTISGKNAFALARKPQSLNLTETQVKGAQNFAYRGP